MSRTSLFLVVSSSTCEAGEPTATGTAGLGGDTVKMVGPVAEEAVDAEEERTMLALMRAEESRLAGRVVWLARD